MLQLFLSSARALLKSEEIRGFVYLAKARRDPFAHTSLPLPSPRPVSLCYNFSVGGKYLSFPPNPPVIVPIACDWLGTYFSATLSWTKGARGTVMWIVILEHACLFCSPSALSLCFDSNVMLPQFPTKWYLMSWVQEECGDMTLLPCSHHAKFTDNSDTEADSDSCSDG